MGFFDWLQSNIPDSMGVDQQVPETPVIPQQESFPSPQEWLAKKQEQEQARQLPVDMQVAQAPTPVQENAPFPSPQEWLRQKQAQEQGITWDDTADVLTEVGSKLAQPAATALEAISYLDKPRGAIAGTVKAIQDDTPILEGAQKGWNENTSWKETFNPDWVKENPKTAAVAGLAADIVADPLWLLTPAKAVSLAAKGSKAVGLTDKVINPAATAFKSSEFGQKAIAAAEDFAGKNRVADDVFDFNAARAKDQVEGQDYVDAVKDLKKQYGDDANVLNNYIEAKPKDLIDKAGFESERRGIIIAAKDGTLAKNIADGTVTREQAFNTLRDAGEEIPNHILQDKQILAKEAGETIPDYVYRDQVLQSIPNENLRRAVQTIGDKFIELNKKQSDALRSTGRLSNEQYARFLDGEHLRRSTTKYDNPEKFLEDLRKNGTPEEYARAYKDLVKAKTPGQGYGQAHRVDTKDFVGRQALSDETLQRLGLITDPEYRIMDTINRGSKTLREDEFLDKVAAAWSKPEKEAIALSRNLPERRRYIPVPDSPSYGTLAGKYIPKDIYDQVLKTTGNAPDKINKTWQKMVSWWKVEKLANPASVMRNFYSGVPMANAFGKVPFQSLPKYMGKVSLAYKQQGKNHPLLRELRESGILGNEWSRQELKSIIGENPKGMSKVADIGMNAFGAPDKFWKAVVYTYHKDQGKTAKEAAQMANKALLDYSSVPDWVNNISKSGLMPFIKFPLLAGKETAKALYTNPAQVTKYTKAQNQVNTEDREKILPDYMKSKTLLPTWNSTRTVNGKQQPVQNNIDLSYILPFASDVNFGNPVLDTLQLARTGKNGLGMDVIKPGMTPQDKTKAWGKYLFNAFGPSFPLPIPDSVPLPSNYAGDKLLDGINGNVDAKGRQYDPWSATANSLLGVKNVPINVDEMANQKMKSIEFQMKSTKAMMTQITKDKSLNKDQKAEQLSQHAKQYKELQSQLKDVSAAYKREKQRGAQ